MATDGKKGKTICSKAREVINHMNGLCKQATAEKSLTVPTSRADEKPVKYCGVSVTTGKNN